MNSDLWIPRFLVNLPIHAMSFTEPRLPREAPSQIPSFSFLPETRAANPKASHEDLEDFSSVLDTLRLTRYIHRFPELALFPRHAVGGFSEPERRCQVDFPGVGWTLTAYSRLLRVSSSLFSTRLRGPLSVLYRRANNRQASNEKENNGTKREESQQHHHLATSRPPALSPHSKSIRSKRQEN